jgi:hypothetical protein
MQHDVLGRYMMNSISNAIEVVSTHFQECQSRSIVMGEPLRVQ